MPDLPTASRESIAVSIVENPGVYALLLGSGISMAAGVPTGWDVTIDLIRRIALQRGVEAQMDWAAWYRAKHAKEPDYSELLEELAATPAERRSILEKYIEPIPDDPDPARKTPTKAHHAIAHLVRDGWIKVIVTTNFDRLLETALREAGVEPTIVHSPDAAKGAEPLAHARCYVLKLHGDYKDTRILNTEAELENYEPEFDRLLDRIFDEYGLIVCGWSANWDKALRAAMLRAPNRRYGGFWATRSDPSADASALIHSRKFKSVKVKNADEFFETLRLQVTEAKKLARRAPSSIELTLAAAKRFLPRQEHRIDLHDLVNTEMERYVGSTQSLRTNTNAPLTNDAFRDRIEKFEAAIDPLSRLLATLGRFGSGEEMRIARDALKHLTELAFQPQEGLVVFNDMRIYPVTIAFAALCLGLLRSDRIDEFAELMNFEVLPQPHEKRRSADQFLLPRESLGDSDVWNRFMNTRFRMPFHERLYGALSRSMLGVLAPLSDLNTLYIKFELYGAFSYMVINSSKSDVTAALNAPQNPLEWMPIGRLVHDERSRNSVLESLARIDHVTISTVLRKFSEWPGVFDDFRQNLTNLVGRLRWR